VDDFEQNEMQKLLSLMQTEPAILLIGQKLDFENSSEILIMPWNCIFTSIKTLRLSYALGNKNRRVRDITDENDLQDNALDKRYLHLVRLYGEDSQEKANNVLPAIAKAKADKKAQALLAKLTQMIKRFGVVIIVGYHPNIDSLPMEDLYASLCEFRTKSVYFFDIDQEAQENVYIKDLQQNGIAKVFSSSLANYFEEYKASLDEDLDFYDLEEKEDKIQIFIDGKSVYLEKDVIFETQNFSTLMNMQTIRSIHVPQYCTDDLFYAFLKNSAIMPQWYGYEYKFNLERRFESQLYQKVKNSLDTYGGRKEHRPILLSGQTGSGKSIAVAAVAYKIFCEQTYPVIFMNNPDLVFTPNIRKNGNGISKQNSPIFNALDALIRHIEDLGAKAVLVIWDSSSYSRGRNNNFKLFQALKSRGRKIQLVCTSYEIPKSEHAIAADMDTEKVAETVYDSKFDVVEAPISLDPEKELISLKKLLIEKAMLPKHKADELTSRYAFDPQNFLAVLYQLFENIRTELAIGVQKEVSMSIQDITDRVSSIQPSTVVETVMASAFQKAMEKAKGKALVNLDIEKTFPENIEILAPYKFVILLAVCSNFKLPVPYDLAMRTLGSIDYEVIKELLDVPFLNFADSREGEYSVSIRTPLEARLLLQINRISYSQQVDCIINLLSLVNSHGVYGQGKEVKLLEKLIRIIGPNSSNSEKRYYWNEYPRIIDALRELRDDKHIIEPMLVSQEITLMREYYGREQKFPDSDRIVYLKKAIEIADSVLEHMEYSSYNLGMRNALKVEAANSKLRLCALDSSVDKNYYYTSIKRDLQEIISTTPDDIYAYVTLLEASIKEFKNCSDDIKKAGLLVAMCNIVECVRSENSDVASSDYFRQKASDIYSFLDESDISDGYFDELISYKSDAGIYIKAQKILRDANIDFKKSLESAKQIKACEAICDLIEKYDEITMFSPACQYMLLQVLWLKYNKEPVFTGEECQCTAMNEQEWKKILSICINYEDNFIKPKVQGYHSPHTILYLKALAYAQLQQYEESMKTFKKIDEEASFGVGRIKTRHILCNENGVPVHFHGRLMGKYDDIKKRGYAKIDGINSDRGGVYYFGPNIDTSKYDSGTNFTDFQIGLNYIGFRLYRKLKKKGDK